eukprot:jgi/Hompol1/770/HPOL_001370-RA
MRPQLLFETRFDDGRVLQSSLVFVSVKENQLSGTAADADADTNDDASNNGAAAQSDLELIDGILLFYDVCDSQSFVHIASFLDALNDMSMPAALLGCNNGDTCGIPRQVDQELGIKMATLFDVMFAEICTDTQPDSLQQQYQVIHDVCRDLLRVMIERRLNFEFTRMFLIVYPKFLRASELLDRLVDRFDYVDAQAQTDGLCSPGSNRGGAIHPIQLRVCNVLIYWMSNYWSDFSTQKMRTTLIVFLDACSTRASFGAICQRLAQLIFQPTSTIAASCIEGDWRLASSEDEDEDEECMPGGFTGNILSPDLLSPVSTAGSLESQLNNSLPATDRGASQQAKARQLQSLNQPSRYEGLSLQECLSMSALAISRAILDQESDVIAQQLCLMEWSYLRRVKQRDLLHELWTKSKPKRPAESVSDCIGMFNRISAWVATSVLIEKEPKLRARVIAKFMRIAQWVRTHNNYNTLLAIIGGLTCSSIIRLRQTHQLLAEARERADFDELEKLMSLDKSLANYRAALKQSSPPCIPYLGTFTRDLVYIEEKHKDWNADGTLNINKIVLIGDLLLTLHSFGIKLSWMQRLSSLLIQASPELT